jgi:hypothetical protein
LGWAGRVWPTVKMTRMTHLGSRAAKFAAL